MRAFVLVACLAVVAVARPDVGGYTYSGLQQQQHGGPALHQQQQLPVEHQFASFGPAAPQHQVAPPQMTYLAPPTTSVLPHEPIQEHHHQHHHQQQLQQVGNHQAADSYSQAYAHSSLPQDGGYPYAPAQTKIHKHIYVHVPPKDFEDDDAITPRVHHQIAPKQKHYKIVFIKAPSAPAIRAPVIPPAPQNEEKTLIYVLHKKPETAQEIVIPSPPPTKPSKPEVYFIKYKTKKEELPVYGPPPPQQQHDLMEPRHIEQPSVEYGAPTPTAIGEEHQIGGIELSAPLTTLQPIVEEQTAPAQFVNEAPAEVYGAPTMAAIRVEELAAPTASAPQQPSNQYLAPTEQQHIEQQQQHVPSNSYGPPGRFFNKKKK